MVYPIVNTVSFIIANASLQYIDISIETFHREHWKRKVDGGSLGFHGELIQAHIFVIKFDLHTQVSLLRTYDFRRSISCFISLITSLLRISFISPSLDEKT